MLGDFAEALEPTSVKPTVELDLFYYFRKGLTIFSEAIKGLTYIACGQLSLWPETTEVRSSVNRHTQGHGGLLSLNAWKLSPTPRKIEMVTYTHSNEPDNRCLLEPAVHGVHKT